MHIGFPEILVIVLFAFIIFGPKRLPEIGKSIGKAINQFNGAKEKVDETLKKEGLDSASLREASKNPFVALDKLATIADKMEEIIPVEDAEAEGETEGEPQELAESAETADDAPAESNLELEQNVPSEPVEELQEAIEESASAEEPAEEPQTELESHPEPQSEPEPESGEEGERA
ncbi:MAG: twin-arginine translocase TatA/TatE family subunit [bacterium]|nr:twin-arginine translocase TatA/TatE family subunit [bacterium]